MTMKILAFDISGFACSIAIGALEENACKILASYHQEMVLGQAHILMPKIHEILSAHSLEISDLDAIAVTRGPGSFTGIRAGIAAAKGMAISHDLPVLPVNNFDVYAFLTPKDEFPLIVALETKRRDLYVQLYNTTREFLWGDGESLEIEEILPRIQKYGIKSVPVVGDGQNHLEKMDGFSIDKNVCSIRADDMLSYVAHIGVDAFNRDETSIKPLYLRPALV